MMNYKYVVESFYDDAKVTVETNDPEVAVLEMMQRDMEGVHAHCVDGLTGEILALINHPGQFAQPEFALMTLGVLMAHQMEQEEPAGDPCTEHGVICLPGFVPEPEELATDLPDLLRVLGAIAEIKGGLPQ